VVVTDVCEREDWAEAIVAPLLAAMAPKEEVGVTSERYALSKSPGLGGNVALVAVRLSDIRDEGAFGGKVIVDLRTGEMPSGAGMFTGPSAACLTFFISD
jgi:hypothetical protein